MRVVYVAILAVLLSPAAASLADDVGVSVTVGEPGFYGHLEVGNVPPPVLIYPQPVIVEPVPVGIVRPPIYVHVPPGQEKKWHHYCSAYDACAQPVYFVQDSWYNEVYVPEYRKSHGHGYVSVPASIADDVGIAVTVGEPGFYGHLEVGNVPPPVLIYPQPVIVQQIPVGVVRPPIYVHVPPGQEKKWHRYCGAYDACGQPVYFVQDSWYNDVYVPEYRKSHGHGHGRGNGNGHRGNGHGHGNGNDNGGGNNQR